MTGFSALPISEQDSSQDDSHWAGEPKILGPRWAHLPTLTVGLLGVQVFWSVEMSYASPYLLSLGLTKSMMAIVFLAGPLSGLIMQPLIGVLADNSKSRFGRRRPFLLLGSALCGVAMFLLGFTRPIASMFTSLNTTANGILTIWLAVLAIYCIDFSINAVQAMDRALLVDTLPPARQARGNAWAARMLGIGNVAGFFVGNLDLPRLFPFFGSAELEVLSVIATLLLVSTHLLMSYFVKEKVLLISSTSATGIRKEMQTLWKSLRTLPRMIKKICIIQFFAWLGWFPVLFYTTVYIGELHKRASPVPENDDAALALDAEATRLGTRALFFSSVVSLVASVMLPFFVTETGQPMTTLSPRRTWTKYFQVYLSSLWALSHLVFAMCMAATFFTSSVSGATFIMATTGFSWAVTQWAPFSLLAEAILAHPMAVDAGTIHLADTRLSRRSDGEEDETQQLIAQEENGTFSRSPSPELGRIKPQHIMRNSRARLSRIDVDAAVEFMHHDQDGFEPETPNRKTGGNLSSQAGVILGIHNIFIVVPQFLVTAMSSIIFAIFEPDKSVLHGHHPGSTVGNSTVTQAASPNDVPGGLFVRQEEAAQNDGPNSVAIIFRIGGVAAAIAFLLCWRLSRELKH